ncbi:MAG: alpha/beta hydrolase family protein, partial [Anaerolineae bacterium]
MLPLRFAPSRFVLALITMVTLASPLSPHAIGHEQLASCPLDARAMTLPALASLCPRWTNVHTGLQASGAPYVICLPGDWNGQLLIFAHGFVSPYDPLGIPQEHLYAGSLSLVDATTMQGTAFAASAYATNGLATLEGLADTVDVASIFTALAGEPSRTYLVGASQGGLIAVLGIERYPELFDAALSACGPIGDMASQAAHFGDVRVLWDQVYPGTFPAAWRQDPGDPGWIDERDVQ